jgi:hypothetical protein
MADKVAQQVYITSDYSKFRNLQGNRDINRAHVNKLKESMLQEVLTDSFVSVNENMVITDGAHRYTALKELGLPVRYIVTKGYGLSQAQRRNQNARTWKPGDFLKGYCDTGNPDYLMFKKFQERYKFTHGESLTLLTGSSTDSRENTHLFQQGKFKVKSYGDACRMADQLEAIGAYYPNYRRRSFVQAMITLFNDPRFNFDTFMRKLSIQPKALVDCVNSKDYIELIEDIFNYKNRDKVNFRF